MKNAKFLVIGALAIGLGIGSIAGYTNIQSTDVAQAEVVNSGIGIADVEKTTSVEEIGRGTSVVRLIHMSLMEL